MIHSKGGHYAQNTIRTYTGEVRALAAALGAERPLWSIGTHDILGHYAALRARGAASHYLQTRDKALRLFLDWCVAEQVLVASPLDGERRIVAADPPVTSIPERDYELLLGLCPTTTWLGVRGRAILTLLWETGVRRAEACLLDLEHYDARAQQLHVPGEKSPSATRTVGVPDALAYALDDWVVRARGRAPGPLLVQERGGRRMTPDSLGHWLARLGRTAGLAGIKPHRFRHTFAVRMLRSPVSMDLYTLAQLMGHSRIEHTAKYLRAMQAEEAAAEHVRRSRLPRR
jgi:integrase